MGRGSWVVGRGPWVVRRALGRGSCVLKVPLNQCALRAEILSAAIFYATEIQTTRLKEKASFISVDFVYLSNVLKLFSIKCLSAVIGLNATFRKCV